MNKYKIKKILSKSIFPLVTFIIVTAAILVAFKLPRTCKAEKVVVKIEKINNDGSCTISTYADDRLVSSIASKGNDCRFYLVNHSSTKGK